MLMALAKSMFIRQQQMCKCGNLMRFQTGWEEHHRYLVLNRQIEKAGEVFIKKNHNISSDYFYDIIEEGSIEVLYCTKCGRLWLSDEGEPTYTAYCKEEE